MMSRADVRTKSEAPVAGRPPDGGAWLRSVSVAYQSTHVLRAALETRLLATLVVEAASVGELAERLNVDPDGLSRLLECCRDLGLVERKGLLWRTHPSIARWVDPRTTNYVGDHLRVSATQGPVWDVLAETVGGGERADRGLGALPRRAVHADFLTQGLAGRVSSARAVVARLTTPDDRTVLVMFGGSGEFVDALRSVRPSTTIEIVDHPELLVRTRTLLGSSDGLEYRPLGSGDTKRRYDVIIFPHVLRGVSDSQFRAFLNRSRQSLVPRGQIIVADIFRESSLGDFVPWLDLSLYVSTKAGRVRSCGEADLIAQSVGFEPGLVVHAPGVTGISYRKESECQK